MQIMCLTKLHNKFQHTIQDQTKNMSKTRKKESKQIENRIIPALQEVGGSL